MKPWIIKALVAISLAPGLSACGVKGDPLPPETVPRLGRGHPTFTKASRQLTPDFQSSKKSHQDNEEEEDEE